MRLAPFRYIDQLRSAGMMLPQNAFIGGDLSPSEVPKCSLRLLHNIVRVQLGGGSAFWLRRFHIYYKLAVKYVGFQRFAFASSPYLLGVPVFSPCT